MAWTQAAAAVVAISMAVADITVHAAESYPARPLRAIVPFTAGSTTDIIARSVTERLHGSLGQNIIIDNRAGAGGTLGAALAAQAPPDGYTLLIHSSSHTVNPAMYAKLPYDTVRDFAGITPLASIPNVLVIAPSRNIRSVKELITAAKAKPGSINFASAGQGSATHLNAEKFRMRAGIDATHVPYKGSPEALVDVMTGRVHYYFCPVAPAIPFIKDGRLTALAVGSAKRSSVLPDIPTTIEAGVPGSDYNFWIGLLVPAKTVRPTVTRLHAETAKALASAEVKKRYTELGADTWLLAPEQFDATIREEIGANKAIVQAAGLKPN
jgi:tripartite-type tricarboxylate transporter receptor subunit TctC